MEIIVCVKSKKKENLGEIEEFECEIKDMCLDGCLVYVNGKDAAFLNTKTNRIDIGPSILNSVYYDVVDIKTRR